MGDARGVLTQIDAALASTEFLVGANLTLADITVFSALVLPYRLVFDTKFMNGFKNIKRWFEGLKVREEIISVWGKIFECKTIHPFPEPR